VNDQHVSDRDALRQDHEDVTASLGAMADPSVEVPAPAARPESRQRAGSRAEAMLYPMHSTAQSTANHGAKCCVHSGRNIL
jgi:hypothetical protein